MSAPRVLVVPGGTSIGAVALTNAALHKLVELHEERLAEPAHPAPRTIVVLRDPARVAPSTLRGASQTLHNAFPAEDFPEVAEHLSDPSFFDGIDLIVPTSGSTAGRPHLVGLSIEAIAASVASTDAVLGGPGRWILALPAHHIAGAMVLLRSAFAGTNPRIVDTSDGFAPAALLPAIAGATSDPSVPAYLSLVPTQLVACLDAGDEVTNALARLSAVLVGGSAIRDGLLERAAALGIRTVATYGMTETCGGCVYDGVPLAGVQLRAVHRDGHSRLAISGPTLLTRYLDGETPFFDESGRRWLLTADMGQVSSTGSVAVQGRADDVIVTGGLSVAPAPVQAAVLSCEGIEDAWVTPSEDAKWGQVITALVVPDRMPANAAEMADLGKRVRDHVGSRLGRAYAPRRVVALDAMPYRAGMKIDRQRAARLAVEALGTVHDWWR